MVRARRPGRGHLLLDSIYYIIIIVYLRETISSESAKQDLKNAKTRT